MTNPRDHIASMAEYQHKWDQLVLSTEPVNKPKAEDLINRIYQQVGGEPPQIIWVDSPWNPLVRTAKIYERIPNKDNYYGYTRKLTDATFHSHQRKIVRTTFTRLGLLSRAVQREGIEYWEGVPLFHLSGMSASLSLILWRTQHAGFYYGNHYQDFAFFDWCCNAVGLVDETRSAALAIELAQEVAWWRPHESLCFISERPTKLTFSNPTGPAIQWGDKKFYMINRVEVPDHVVTKPSTITLTDIVTERNAEVRRIMIERYKSGIGDFIKDAKAIRRDHDERYGTLWRIPREGEITRYIGRGQWNSMTDMYYLEVVNRTPEPDGSFKHYFLRMPPSIPNGRGATRTLNTAKEAYDWSFGLPVTTWDMVES